MKNKYLFFAFALIFIPFVSFAQEAPMRGWEFNSYFVELNGRTFGHYQYPESWCEQDGYALVQGIRRHYWLYDTYSYRNGRANEIYDRIIPYWVENMGYAIDFDNIQVYYPNEDLASSVKALMSQRKCDISVTLVTDLPGYDYVAINNYNRDTGVYDTIIYPLYKGGFGR
jgi:hypothetical protein